MHIQFHLDHRNVCLSFNPLGRTTYTQLFFTPFLLHCNDCLDFSLCVHDFRLFGRGIDVTVIKKKGKEKLQALLKRMIIKIVMIISWIKLRHLIWKTVGYFWWAFESETFKARRNSLTQFSWVFHVSFEFWRKFNLLLIKIKTHGDEWQGKH